MRLTVNAGRRECAPHEFLICTGEKRLFAALLFNDELHGHERFLICIGSLNGMDFFGSGGRVFDIDGRADNAKRIRSVQGEEKNCNALFRRAAIKSVVPVGCIFSSLACYDLRIGHISNRVSLIHKSIQKYRPDTVDFDACQHNFGIAGCGGQGRATCKQKYKKEGHDPQYEFHIFTLFLQSQ